MEEHDIQTIRTQTEWMKWMEGKELKLFCFLSMIALFATAFLLETPMGLAEGISEIIFSRDALITDYFELVGFGPAFLNAALVFAVGMILITAYRIPFTGITIAALFINAGFGLWGKNLCNIWPMIFGTMLYARLHRTRFQRYIYTALFGSCLAPLVTELVVLLPFGHGTNMVCAVSAGILIGFVLPPLSMHTASMHMGYNLFNVGFSAGILAFAIVCILRSFGMVSNSVMIWRYGIQTELAVGIFLYFLATFFFGLFLCRGKIGLLKKIWRHPGRAVADFILMDGPGAALMNMGMVGMVCEAYIVLVRGDLSGPVVGAIFAVFGFAAFGVHIKNYLPVLAGVYLSTFLTVYDPHTPGIQLAAIFSAALAPVAGQFGIVPGVIAGFLNAVIVVCTGELYGGLNLYNSGFGAGWVAIVVVPLTESFMKRFTQRKRTD